MDKITISKNEGCDSVTHVNLNTMKTQVELHESAIKLLKMIENGIADINEMLKYNVEKAEPHGLVPFKDEVIDSRAAAVGKLKRSYNNVLKELVTKSMEQ